MADTSEAHIVSVPSQPPAPYDATSDAPAGPWRKVETGPAGGAGHGWDPVPDGGQPPWRQT